jgi:hypothetical protein
LVLEHSKLAKVVANPDDSCSSREDGLKDETVAVPDTAVVVGPEDHDAFLD